MTINEALHDLASNYPPKVESVDAVLRHRDELLADLKLYARLTRDLAMALTGLSNCYWDGRAGAYTGYPVISVRSAMGMSCLLGAWEQANKALDACTSERTLADGDGPKLRGDLVHRAASICGGWNTE